MTGYNSAVSHLTFLLLGVELGGPGTSGAVSASDATLQLFAAETASLPTYGGPLLRPELAVQRGKLWLGLSPAAHLSRDGDVRVRQGSLSLRPRYQGDTLLVGVDVAASSGRATRDGDVIASSGMAGTLAPTVGARAALGDNLTLSGRLLWTMVSIDTARDQSLSAAVSASWRL